MIGGITNETIHTRVKKKINIKQLVKAIRVRKKNHLNILTKVN